MGERMGTKEVLLHAFFAGPADLAALAGRVARLGLGDPGIGSPELARGLRELVGSGMLRRWRRRSRALSGGRAAFYELTSAGLAEAEALRPALKGLTGAGSGRGGHGSKAVDRRLKRSLDISAVAGALRRRGNRAASRR